MFPTSCQSGAIKTLQNIERAEYVVKRKVTCRATYLFKGLRRKKWNSSQSVGRPMHRTSSRGRQLLASVLSIDVDL